MPDAKGEPVQSSSRPEGALRIAFFVHSLSYVRFFDSVIRGLLARGHSVQLLLHRVGPGSPDEASWLDELSGSPAFGWAEAPSRGKDSTARVAKRLRQTADYLRFLDPRFDRAPYLVTRARGRAPEWLRRVMDYRALRRPWLVRRASQIVEWLDASLPPSKAIARGLEELDVDLLAVSPHLMPGSRHSDFIGSARSLGIPTCLCVASWDNLSSKQFIRELPDRMLVWNDVQRREAIELHGVPEERIVVTGAQSFDHWFGWTPRPREEFCALVELDPARPYLAYVGGALAPGRPTEAEWARSWVERLRTSRYDALQNVQILVRPHPKRLPEWLAAGFADPPEGVRMWPRASATMPIGARSRADYFDTLRHSVAVVGLNTSAMIEAAIAGREVHTVLVPEFATSQRGTFHFDYLSEVGGGILDIAATWDEHLEALDRAVRGADADERGTSTFLRDFIRPQGLDRPATPLVLDALEETAALTPAPATRRPALGSAAVSLMVFLSRWRRIRLWARSRRVLRIVGRRLVWTIARRLGRRAS